MRGISWAVCARLLLVVPLTLMPHLTSSQLVATRSITDPGFSCGVPWGPNGEEPTETARSKRQIILPDEQEYHKYLDISLSKEPSIDTRDDINPEEEESGTGGSFCGTAVISDRFLLTAAHCVLNDEFGISVVRLGDLDLSTDDEANSRAKDYEIREIFVHPNYRPDTNVRYFDLALLMTYEKIEFNDIVYPMCIPSSPPVPGDIVTASGYGLYNATYESPHQLEANFTVIDTETCENEYIQRDQEARLRVTYPVLLQKTDIFCAIDDMSDACQGDSGGPVIQERDGKDYLVGLVSGGPSCRGNNKSVLPGFYLSTSNHANFISDVVFGGIAPIPPPEPAPPSK